MFGVLIVHETFDKGTDQRRVCRASQDVKNILFRIEGSAGPWLPTPQVEAEDFMKRAKRLAKEIEELWACGMGRCTKMDMIWRWLLKTCVFTNKTDKTGNWGTKVVGF